MKLLKGIMMWITAFSCFLLIMSIDSLSLTTMFGWLLVNTVLVNACIKHISEDEFYIISGMKAFDRFLS